MKTYRNSLRSEKMIKQAFIELLQTTDISKITVKDLTELADLSRNTFYAHYNDIYAVKEAIENEVTTAVVNYLDDFLRNFKENEDTLPFFKKIMEFVENDKKLIRALLNSNSNNKFIEDLKTILIDHTLMGLKDKRIKDNDGFTLFLNILYSGVINVLQQYLNGKTTHKSLEIATKVNDIYLACTKLYL